MVNRAFQCLGEGEQKQYLLLIDKEIEIMYKE